TTMKIATGYLLPNEGTVEVAGIDVVKNPKQAKRQIGYLPEHNPLYLDMYVREFLEFTASIFKLKSSEKSKRIEELIEITGLTAERKKKIGQLSKGYRQRVGLAQALIHDPQVLILDEPTTGLDPNQIVEIRNLIAEIGKSKTVVLSTHIMQEVSAICHRAVIINRGKIVADRNIEDLIQSNSSQPQLRLRFKDQYDLNWLKLLDGVQQVKSVADKEVKVILRSQEIGEIQAIIFTEAAKRNHVLLGIELVEASLESVFQELTK
ncbi:MAG TPA: ATP-binding cassette domain-containing protein, partial [Catalimonadaceae bacterium]|nr:ATP-binding cassette domain-containing protein [Catalimonadaceae bacterium]